MKQNAKPIRLDRHLTESGYGTRNEVTKLIKRGHVNVNQDTIRKGSHKVTLTDTVEVDGVLVVKAPPVYLWHKPVGVQSTIGDPMGRLSIAECGAKHLLPRYHPVGRLDADTSGLLLFSKLGHLTQRLLHPKHAIPRRYRATASQDFTIEHQLALERGVETSLGTFQGSVVQMKQSEIELVVTEGKHRMVRRMLANVQQPVETLQRLEYGPFKLGDLGEDELRPPSETEWAAALAMSLPGF